LAAEPRSSVAPGASDEFYNQLVNCLPHLRAFARVLCRQHDLVDDLVQDAVVRALAASNQFQQGTNFRAWMFTILRNQNITTFRRKRIIPASLDEVSQEVFQGPPQEDALMIEELDNAVQRLSPLRREALILVVVHGLSYDEAAAVCGCAVGTIKSRVARARAELHEMVLSDRADDNGVTDGKARRRRVRHLGNGSEGNSACGRRMCDEKAWSLRGG
jgi:RNA polymerase sigma-70 factor (ECF subfamily)